MLIDRLCSPALIYLAFSIIQLILDMSQGKFKLAIAKLFICLIFDTLRETKDISKTKETDDVSPVEEPLSVTAFEPFSSFEKMSCKGKTKPYSKKREPVQSSVKKSENLNNDVKKLELGAL
jgi:hypothetical protein